MRDGGWPGSLPVDVVPGDPPARGAVVPGDQPEDQRQDGVPHDAAEREFTREGTDVNWFDEGKETLARRVQQILTGIHWAEEPPSRICHMISNVQILSESPAGQVPAEVAVKSRFLVYRNRVETETDVLVGKREDLLRRVDGGWKIARRKIVLDQSVLLTKNLTFFF